MSETTKIQWADATFNPWIGCTKVSPGCANCYAENTTRARVLRSHGHETWGRGKPRSMTSKAYWRKPYQWAAGTKVFPSLCDWLDDEVPIGWFIEFLGLIYETQHLTWILLTKRPENFFGRELPEYIQGRLEAAQYSMCDSPLKQWLCLWGNGHPPTNVWILASVEDQKRADERIPELLRIPAVIRGLSVEPMLERIDFKFPMNGDSNNLNAGSEHPRMRREASQAAPTPLDPANAEAVAKNVRAIRQIVERPSIGINWIIFGGESGKGARPCNIEWIRGGMDQCQKAGVKVFVKQLGGNAIGHGFCRDCADDGPICPNTGLPCDGLKDPKGGDMSEWPDNLKVRGFPDTGRFG